jgi:hypothetical protein
MWPKELLKDYGWVLCDDYNLVENRWDKSSNCDKAISNKEMMAWDVFKQSLGMDEPIRSNGIFFFHGTMVAKGMKKCLHTLIKFIPKFLKILGM